MSDLSLKKCAPCSGNTPSMSVEEINKKLGFIEGCNNIKTNIDESDNDLYVSAASEIIELESSEQQFEQQLNNIFERCQQVIYK